jgi:colicin import membrane protein
MTTATLRPPEAAGIGRGLALALFAHLLLFLALSWGLHWHSDSSPAFEAELWSAVPQAAAPKEQAPPEPEPKPEPPKPDLKAQQRAAEEEAQQQRDAEIAIAKAKKLKEDKLKEEKAREDALKLEREKAAKEKEAKDKAAKEKAEQERKKADDAAKAAKDAKQADAQREKQRQDFLRRMQGMAGATGAPESTGTAQQSSAPSAGYAGRIKARIRPLIIYSGDGADNPTTEVQVSVAPDGLILGAKPLKPSGDAEWDRAVLRAIEKAERLPRDVDGRVPPLIVITFKPRE